MIPTAWEAGNVDQVRQLLDRHADEYHGFEWRYWDRQINGERRNLVIRSHEANTFLPTDFALNESGTRVALRTLRRGHVGFVPGVPPKDLAPGTRRPPANDSLLKVFDTSSGAELLSHLLPPSGAGSHLLLSRDGSRVALALGGKGNVFMPIDGSISQVRVVDVATGRVLVDHREEKDVILGFAFSPDGRRFLATVAEVRPRMTSMKVPSSLKCAAHVWDLEANPVTELCRVECMYPPPGTTGVVFSPDGSRLAAETRGGIRPQPIAVWDAATGKELVRCPNSTQASLQLEFTGDGKRLIGWAGDRAKSQVYLAAWNATTGTEHYHREIPVHLTVEGFFNPRLTVSGAKAVISTHAAAHVQDCYLVDLATGELVRTDERVSSSSTLRFSPDGKMIVTMERNSLVLRDAATGRVLNRFRGYTNPVLSLAFSPDGALLRSLDRLGNFKEWVANPAKAIVLEGANARPSGEALSPNARWVAGPHQNVGDLPPALRRSRVGQPTIWDLATGKSRTLPMRDDRGVSASWRPTFVFSPNSQYVGALREPSAGGFRMNAAPAVDKQSPDLTVWESQSGKEAAHIKLLPGVRWVAIDPNGRQATVSRRPSAGEKLPATIKGYDLTTGKELWYFEAFDYPLGGSAAYSPDGRRVAIIGSKKSGHLDGSLAVLDAADGRVRLMKELDGTPGTTVAWSPDGTLLAVSAGTSRRQSADLAITLLDAETGDLRRILLGPAGGRGALSRPSFSPDGRRIAAMTRSHLSEANTTMVKMWDTATGHEMMTLTGPGDRAGTGMTSVAFTEDGHRLILLAPTRRPGPARESAEAGLPLQIWDATPRPEPAAIK